MPCSTKPHSTRSHSAKSHPVKSRSAKPGFPPFFICMCGCLRVCVYKVSFATFQCICVYCMCEVGASCLQSAKPGVLQNWRLFNGMLLIQTAAILVWPLDFTPCQFFLAQPNPTMPCSTKPHSTRSHSAKHIHTNSSSPPSNSR